MISTELTKPPPSIEELELGVGYLIGIAVEISILGCTFDGKWETASRNNNMYYRDMS